MKEYITIKCNIWAVYKRDVIKKIVLDDDTVKIMWSNDTGNIIIDEYYPTNARQFFKKLMEDIGANEETKKIKEI